MKTPIEIKKIRPVLHVCKDCLIQMTPLKSKVVSGLFICQKCKTVR